MGSPVCHYLSGRVADVMAPPPPRVPTHLPGRAARKVGALRSSDVLVVEVEGQLVGLLDLSAIGPEGDADPVSAQYDQPRAIGAVDGHRARRA